jgi:hypothetical protein
MRIFQTKPVVSRNKPLLEECCFIISDQRYLIGTLEVSKDGGKTWSLAWQIKYLQKK